MGYPRPFCLHASASLEAGSPSKPGEGGGAGGRQGAGDGLQGRERLHLLWCLHDSRRQPGLRSVLLQATCRTVPPNRSALTRKVGVQCHPVFSQKPSRHPDGWFFCRAELRPREREGRRWMSASPPLRGSRVARCTCQGWRPPVSPWRPQRAGPTGAAPKFQAFPRMGRPPRPSAIPGDLDRETAFKWRGEGELGTIFSALNSFGAHKSFTGVCAYYPLTCGKVAPTISHSRAIRGARTQTRASGSNFSLWPSKPPID